MTAQYLPRWWPATARGQLWLVWALVAAAGLWAYANSFSAALSFDNTLVIVQDPRIRSLSWHSLRAIFTEDYWRPTFPSDLYRPFTTLSYLVNYRIFANGKNPPGYHAINLAIHLANAAWVVVLTEKFAPSRVLALLAGLIFVTHPVTVESVTNVVGRADLLAGFFVLAALYFHWENSRTGFISASIAGILCKENAIVALPAAVALDWIMRPTPLRSRVFRYWTMLPAAAVFLTIQLTIGSSSPVRWQYFVDNPIAGASWGPGFLTACSVQARYIGLLLWPARLSCDYSYDQIPLVGTGHPAADALGWAGLVLALAAPFALWRWRTDRLLILGAVSYVLFALPTANFLKVIGSIMAERFLYLPLIGFAWMLASAAGHLLERAHGRTVVLSGAIAIAAALAVRSHARNRDWQSELSLWTSAAAAAPESYKTHKGLASALDELDSSEPGVDRAIAEAKKGLAILDRPEIDSAVERRDPTLFIDLGKYYQEKADLRAAAHDPAGSKMNLEQAVAVLRRSVEVNRWINGEARRIQLAHGVAPGRIHTIGREDIFHSLSVALLKLGRPAEAVEPGLAAVHLNPFDPAAFEFLAACEIRLHHTEPAILGLYLAILANRNYTQAWDELGTLYSRRSPPVGPVWKGTGDARTLDSENPAIRPDLLDACRRYAQLLLLQAYPREADDFRQFARRAFHFTMDDLAWTSSDPDPLPAVFSR